ncbi:MAG: Hsp20/alpha crystallin family protein [Bacteroidia bacterium]|nr:MAG: Hsp20/alpha crystallin family protein [Bacteroidia bacterium]
MTIIRWHKRPMRANIFDDMFEKGFQTGFERNCGCVPATNILEDDKGYEIQLAVPGMKKEDFRMEVEDNVLSVSFEKKEEEKNSPGVEYLRREFEMDEFTRSFSIPKTVDAEQIKARYDNGILYISIPKMDKTRLSKQIKVS